MTHGEPSPVLVRSLAVERNGDCESLSLILQSSSYDNIARVRPIDGRIQRVFSILTNRVPARLMISGTAHGLAEKRKETRHCQVGSF